METDRAAGEKEPAREGAAPCKERPAGARRRMPARAAAVLACNAALAVAEPAVWASMALREGGGVLSSAGLESLKYFTVLSNLLLGLASLLCAVCAARSWRRGGAGGADGADRRTEKADGADKAGAPGAPGVPGGAPMPGGPLGIPRPVRVLKYVAVVATTLTFAVVFLAFGPAIGYGRVLSGSNFWFHLVLPVFALAEFCALEAGSALSRADVAVSLVPPFVYGVAYWANIVVNGAGTWQDGNDWYGLAQGGPLMSLAAFVLTLALTWGIALLVRRANARFAREA